MQVACGMRIAQRGPPKAAPERHSQRTRLSGNQSALKELKVKTHVGEPLIARPACLRTAYLALLAVALVRTLPAQTYKVGPSSGQSSQTTAAPAKKQTSNQTSSQQLGFGSNIQNARLARAAEESVAGAATTRWRSSTRNGPRKPVPMTRICGSWWATRRGLTASFSYPSVPISAACGPLHRRSTAAQGWRRRTARRDKRMRRSAC